jgi:hypothetical protein
MNGNVPVKWERRLAAAMPTMHRNAKSRQKPPGRKPYKSEVVRGRVVALHAAGKSNRQIAELEGIDRQTVSRVLSRPEAVDLINRYKSRLLLLMPKALLAVEQSLSCDDPHVKAGVAMKLVDKLGGYEELIGAANTVSPEAQREHQRLLMLGRLTDMQMRKCQLYDMPLPPDLASVREEIQSKFPEPVPVGEPADDPNIK